MSAGDGLVPAVPAVTSRYHWPADQLITSRIPSPKQEAECQWRSGCYFHTRKIISFQNIESPRMGHTYEWLYPHHQGHICLIYQTIYSKNIESYSKIFWKMQLNVGVLLKFFVASSFISLRKVQDVIWGGGGRDILLFRAQQDIWTGHLCAARRRWWWWINNLPQSDQSAKFLFCMSYKVPTYWFF